VHKKATEYWKHRYEEDQLITKSVLVLVGVEMREPVIPSLDELLLSTLARSKYQGGYQSLEHLWCELITRLSSLPSSSRATSCVENANMLCAEELVVFQRAEYMCCGSACSFRQATCDNVDAVPVATSVI